MDPRVSEDDKECMFTLTIYHVTFISDIFWYDCKNWKRYMDIRIKEGRRDLNVKIVMQIEYINIGFLF